MGEWKILRAVLRTVSRSCLIPGEPSWHCWWRGRMLSKYIGKILPSQCLSCITPVSEAPLYKDPLAADWSPARKWARSRSPLRQIIDREAQQYWWINPSPFDLLVGPRSSRRRKYLCGQVTPSFIGRAICLSRSTLFFINVVDYGKGSRFDKHRDF